MILSNNTAASSLEKMGVGEEMDIQSGYRLKDKEESVALDGLLYDDGKLYTAIFENNAFATGINESAQVMSLEKEIERERVYFAQLFENSPDAIVMLDSLDRVIKCNRCFEELFGYTTEELYGKFINDYIAPQELKSEAEELSNAVTAGSIVKRETLRRTRSGKNINVVVQGHPIIHRGVQTGIYAIYTDITEIKKREKRIERLALRDSLTGLYNRAFFSDSLKKAAREAKHGSNCFCVMFIDIDDFKKINDNLGHDSGDMVLKIAASRIRKCLGEDDVIARMGGDEFVLLLRDVASRSEAAVKAKKIIDSFKKPVRVCSRECHVSISMGITLYPQDGWDYSEIVRKADMAMYSSKNAGSSGFRFYVESLSKKSREEFEIETGLRHALYRGEMFINYQPIIDISKNRIVGAEALLRWRYGERGLIPPGRFIPVAEKKDMIAGLGEWVLENTCRQIRSWNDMGIRLDFVAVNISVKQLEDREFIEKVRRIVERTGIDPDQLEFEITESISMDNLKNRQGVLNELDKMGIRLALDDFGTGFSSLGNLKKLAVSKLKIDRSFISDINLNEHNTAIVSTIIAIARILGLSVVAEGVETSEQLDFLRGESCDMIQGYFFSVPLSKSDFEKFVKLQSSPGSTDII